MKGLIIRQADSSEVEGFIQWGLDEGWNMPLKDPPTYFATYPEGWLIAEIGGVVVGKLYSTAYPSGLGHIGYIIVAKEWRGKGVGTALLRHSLDNYLTGCQFGVGLYSSVDELPFYKNQGFAVVQKAFRMSRNLNCIQNQDWNKEKCAEGENIVRELNHSDTELEAVAQFDAKLSGAYRPGFWSHFSKSAVILVLSGEEIVGVGAIRSLAKSTRLGPIYATSPSIARTILTRLLDQVASVGGGEVEITLDAFSQNEDAIGLFESAGFKNWNEAFLLVRHSPSAPGTEKKVMTYASAVTPTSGSHPLRPPHPSAFNYKNIFSIASLDFN